MPNRAQTPHETIEIDPTWLDSPIVKRAVKRAGDGAEAVDVLEVLHKMMLDLEDRAPGVPFFEVFEACRTAKGDTGWGNEPSNDHLGLGTLEARRAVGQAALAAGWDKTHLDRLFGGRPNWGPGQRQATPIAEHPAIVLLKNGRSIRETAAELGSSYGYVCQLITRARKAGVTV